MTLLSKSDFQQARESLASKRSWERFTNQTVGGARCSVKLGVNVDGSWWLAVPTRNFEYNVVKGETLADFDRQVGWRCPDCNSGIGGNTPCPACNRTCFVCGEVFNHKDFPDNEHLCGVCGPYKSRLDVREHQGVCRCSKKVTAYVRDKKTLGNDGESVPYHYSKKCHPFRRDGKRLIVNK